MGASGIQREAVANKTIAVFAPELYAVDALANDYTALAVLLKVPNCKFLCYISAHLSMPSKH